MSVASVSPDPGPKEVRTYNHIKCKKLPKVELKSHVMKKPYVLFNYHLDSCEQRRFRACAKNELFRPAAM
jgi:hypothetical protein